MQSNCFFDKITYINKNIQIEVYPYSEPQKQVEVLDDNKIVVSERRSKSANDHLMSID